MRCQWAYRSLRLKRYHDLEWCVPQFGEEKLFEDLALEIFQAGLRWDLILKKRRALRNAFDNFDYHQVAQYSEVEVEKLLSNPAIIRNRRKIEAVISNAKILCNLKQNDVTLAKLTWQETNWTQLDHLVRRSDHLDNSLFISRFMKSFHRYHFKRIGPKTLFSYLQATGVINDHWLHCFRHAEVNELT